MKKELVVIDSLSQYVEKTQFMKFYSGIYKVLVYVVLFIISFAGANLESGSLWSLLTFCPGWLSYFCSAAFYYLLLMSLMPLMEENNFEKRKFVKIPSIFFALAGLCQMITVDFADILLVVGVVFLLVVFVSLYNNFGGKFRTVILLFCLPFILSILATIIVTMNDYGMDDVVGGFEFIGFLINVFAFSRLCKLVNTKSEEQA